MIQRNEYKSSRGILKANIGTEHPGMVVTSSATQFASPPQTSTASPSATPPPATSVEATVEASEISGNSTQNLPRSSPQNAEIAAATTEPGSATPSSDSAPPPTSVCANVDVPGNSTQRLPAPSPKNADMAPTSAETSSATTPAIPPPPTSVGSSVQASKISGNSPQNLPGHSENSRKFPPELPGQSPKNGEMAFATTETSTDNPSAGHPPSTSTPPSADVLASEKSGDSADSAPPASVPPPLAEPTISETPLDSSQENPNVQGGKPESEPESDQGDVPSDPKTPKYKVGTFIIKEMDNICCTGVIHRVIFEKKSFVYSVKLNEVDIEEGIMEDEIDPFVFASDGWIVMKDLDVFVKVGNTDNPAKIDSMVRLSEELVDTKSLRVRWVINNKKSEVDILSVRPMYTTEGDKKRRSVKPTTSNDQHLQSTTSSRPQKSGDGLLEDSNCPRKLLVGLSYEYKHYINCNSFFAKQKNSKMAEKSKRMQQQEVITFRDNFQLYQQERSMKSSLSFQVMLMTGMELYKEEELIDSVMKECDRFAVKLSPQSYLARCLCLMVYSYKNVESDIEVNMTEVPVVYGPLSSFIDRDETVDLELSCFSQMSITIIFSQTSKYTRSY